MSEEDTPLPEDEQKQLALRIILEAWEDALSQGVSRNGCFIRHIRCSNRYDRALWRRTGSGDGSRVAGQDKK